jgi:hypothetical protein
MILIPKENLQILKNLETCYGEAGCLINMLKTARINKEKTNCYDLTHKEVDSCFVGKTLWVPTGQASGHCKFKHKVTRVVIEYQGHNSHKGQNIAPHIQEQIIDQAQKHLNILGNDIFHYQKNDWKDEPNYDQALANYKAFSSSKTDAKK